MYTYIVYIVCIFIYIQYIFPPGFIYIHCIFPSYHTICFVLHLPLFPEHPFMSVETYVIIFNG